MRKYLGLIALLPLTSFATSIPVDGFDQSKLEALLRRMPVAFEKLEDATTHVKKYYVFPKTESSFQITCSADHFRSSAIPSKTECKMTVTGEVKGDEIQVKITDADIVGTLYAAMPVTSSDSRKVYSTERVYGQAYAGNYRELFRYVFTCTQKACDISVSTKKAQ